ncbi:hypothetical protein EFS88_09320 [Staphylococcus pseudintermedius]|nr:hypothetical protein [Staphylococcus pseudintermedius]MCA4772816.1 hypothetical protein [Staphylococcus pseudintermedius]
MLIVTDIAFPVLPLAIINVNTTAKITERNPVTIEITPSIIKSSFAFLLFKTLPKYFCLINTVNILITVAKKPIEILAKLMYASKAVKVPLYLEISASP